MFFNALPHIELQLPLLLAVAAVAHGPRGSGGISAEEGLEPSLFKVMVGGKRRGDAAALHDDEGSTVRKRPVLVGALRMELKARFEQLSGSRHHLIGVGTTNRVQEHSDTRTVGTPRQPVDCFPQDILGQDKPTCDQLGPRDGSRVEGIGGLGQGQEKAGVNKDHGLLEEP